MASELHRLWFRNWDPLGATVRLINQWVPPEPCDRESVLEDSLYAYLLDQLPGFTITRQYGLDRGRVDIVIERPVAIELKYRLNDTGDYHRLIGQLEELARSPLYAVIVLAGETDPDISRRVLEHIEDRFDLGSRGKLVLKP